MATILALDLATKTGWATNSPEMSGVENFKPRTSDSRGMLFFRFSVWFEDMIRSITPDLVLYEMPHQRGKAATQILNGLLAELMKQCDMKFVNYAECHSSQIKKFATGRGNASKEDMMAAFQRQFGRVPEDDNESDAVWLLHYGLQEYGNQP